DLHLFEAMDLNKGYVRVHRIVRTPPLVENKLNYSKVYKSAEAIDSENYDLNMLEAFMMTKQYRSICQWEAIQLGLGKNLLDDLEEHLMRYLAFRILASRVLVGYLEDGSSGYDLFEGDWVWDEKYPLYESRECGFLDQGFRCSENGRPDDFYTKWRWQPKHCNLPRFVAYVFVSSF
ncbi:hypothetical protein GIB67_006388, partial [Kingdonia uniflora]